MKQKFALFAYNPSELHEIRYKIHAHSLSTFRFLTTSRELQEIGANHADFPHFTHSHRKLREICPHGQQSASESSELQENTANYANSAPFAHHSRQIMRNSQYLHTHPVKRLRTLQSYLCTLL